MCLLGGEHCAAAVEADVAGGPLDRLPLVGR
jgi:phytoene desaturase